MSGMSAEETYLPDGGDKFAEVYDLVAARQRRVDARIPRYALVDDDANERVELPEELFRILSQAVIALRAGQAVTVAPHSTTLTTQEAANLLGISRPTLVTLLNKGEIPFERLGSHRRLKLVDVLAYRDRRREAQYAALDAMYAADDADVTSGLEAARSARGAVAAGYRRKH